MTDWADFHETSELWKLFVKKTSTEFHENPTNGLVADTKYQTGRNYMTATWGFFSL
jgi:hypothetical protein